MLRWTLLVSLLAGAAGCGSSAPDDERAATTTAAAEEPPLEVATVPDEAIVPLEEEKIEGGITSTELRPCGWSRRWAEPGRAKPVRVGDTLRSPRKRRDAPIVLPPRDGPRRGAPVLEVVVDEEGRVEEVLVVKGFDPPWPEGDAALAAAVRQWTYEPVVRDGEPVAVCLTLLLTVE